MERMRGQIQEVINRNSFVSLAVAARYNAFLPVYDGGIDFILHRESDGSLFKVQLKSRWSIDRKYLNRDIWVAFPVKSEWYLAPHDTMVEMPSAQKFLTTKSWAEAGIYFVPRPSMALVSDCAPYHFGKIAAVAAAAEEAGAIGEAGPDEPDAIG